MCVCVCVCVYIYIYIYIYIYSNVYICMYRVNYTHTSSCVNLAKLLDLAWWGVLCNARNPFIRAAYSNTINIFNMWALTQLPATNETIQNSNIIHDLLGSSYHTIYPTTPLCRRGCTCRDLLHPLLPVSCWENCLGECQVGVLTSVSNSSALCPCPRTRLVLWQLNHTRAGHRSTHAQVKSG